LNEKLKLNHYITNDITQKNSSDVQKEYGKRWMIEQLHRELKQTTGIEKCQCRKSRIQRNHILCAFFVWFKLKIIGYRLGKTIYQLKKELFKNYLIEQLKNPIIHMNFA
jgi:hypothetical protein